MEAVSECPLALWVDVNGFARQSTANHSTEMGLKSKGTHVYGSGYVLLMIVDVTVAVVSSANETSEMTSDGRGDRARVW